RVRAPGRAVRAVLALRRHRLDLPLPAPLPAGQGALMSKIVLDKPGDYALSHFVVPVRTYLIVFTTLLILTGTTVWVAFHHLGDPWNDVVAIGIAITKATLVIL